MELPRPANYFNYELKVCFISPNLSLLVLALVVGIRNWMKSDYDMKTTVLTGIITSLITIVRDYRSLGPTKITFLAARIIGTAFSLLVFCGLARFASNSLEGSDPTSWSKLNKGLYWMMVRYFAYSITISFYRSVWIGCLIIFRTILFILTTLVEDVLFLVLGG